MDDASGPVVTVFRSRLRSEALDEYAELAPHLEARARSMPGFVEFKTFTAEDGERVSIVVFETWQQHCAWRDDPEHRRAQARGRQLLYEDYTVQVCREVRRRHLDPRHSPAAGEASATQDDDE